MGRVACCKMGRFNLDLYQHAFFKRGLNKRQVGEDEPHGLLEKAMEYAAVVGITVFDESCCLCDLTEQQVGSNQVAAEMVLEKADMKVDQAIEKVGEMEG